MCKKKRRLQQQPQRGSNFTIEFLRCVCVCSVCLSFSINFRNSKIVQMNWLHRQIFVCCCCCGCCISCKFQRWHSDGNVSQSVNQPSIQPMTWQPRIKCVYVGVWFTPRSNSIEWNLQCYHRAQTHGCTHCTSRTTLFWTNEDKIINAIATVYAMRYYDANECTVGFCLTHVCSFAVKPPGALSIAAFGIVLILKLKRRKRRTKTTRRRRHILKKAPTVNYKTDSIKLKQSGNFSKSAPYRMLRLRLPLLFHFSLFFDFYYQWQKQTHTARTRARKREDVQPKQRATTTQQIEQLSRAFYGFVPYLFCDVLLPLLLLLLLLVLPLVFVAVSETGTELNRRRWFSLNCFSCSATPLADRTSSGRGSTGWTRLRLSENVLDHRQKVHFHNRQLWTIHGIHQNPKRKLPIEGAVAPEMFFNLNVISCIKHTVSKSTHFMPTSARFLRHLFFSFAYAVQAKSRTKLGQFHFTICILINIHRVSVRSRLLLRILSVLLHQRMVKWYSLFCFLRNCHPGFCQ